MKERERESKATWARRAVRLIAIGVAFSGVGASTMSCEEGCPAGDEPQQNYQCTCQAAVPEDRQASYDPIDGDCLPETAGEAAQLATTECQAAGDPGCSCTTCTEIPGSRTTDPVSGCSEANFTCSCKSGVVLSHSREVFYDPTDPCSFSGGSSEARATATQECNAEFQIDSCSCGNCTPSSSHGGEEGGF